MSGGFTRATAGEYQAASGLLASAGVNVARFDYSPGFSTLLYERSSTNLLLYSQDLTQSGTWHKGTNITVTSGVGDLAGGANAQTLTATSTGTWNNNNYILSNNTLTGTGTTAIWLRRRTGTGNVYLSPPNGTQNLVTLTSTWRRFSATSTDHGGGIYLQVDVLASGDQVDAFGAQGEALSFASSYIPTTSGSATRGTDALALTIPAGVSKIIYTFDDGSQQTVSVSPGLGTVAASSLNRPNIKSMAGYH